MSDFVFEQKPISTKLSAELNALLAVRVVTAFAALTILFWRSPSTFTNPQFWGEDVFFFYDARVMGWACITKRLAGYMSSAQYLVGVLASYFSPSIAPALFNYAAVLLTLLVVWLVTSPRLKMPLKPLLAIAVVIVRMGAEELGTACNIQWILPIGAFAMLFMRASESKLVLAGESIYIGLMAASGPFCIFLAPCFAWQTLVAKNQSERIRFLLLTTILAAVGLIQGLGIIASPMLVPAIPYEWTLWITIPLKQILTFGIAFRHLQGLTGAIIGAACVVTAAVLACRRPYRTQKIFILLFSLLIAFGGMYKFHNDIASQAGAQRYFYIASVFSLWFICCLSAHARLRPILARTVIVAELLSLGVIRNTPRIRENLEWPIWASYIDSGLSVIAPASPRGWYVSFPKGTNGPLLSLASCIGQNIDNVTTVDALACNGTIVKAVEAPRIQIPGETSIDPSVKLWSAAGSAMRTDGTAVQLVAIADLDGEVRGFGFPGFDDGRSFAGWKAIYYSRTADSRAFGIVDQGKRVSTC
jgi:hypothetical protein